MQINNAISLHKNRINLSLTDILLPMIMILSATRGLFVRTWFAGHTWSMPMNFQIWCSIAVIGAVVLILLLPKLDPVLQVTSALVPFCVWLALPEIAVPEILRSGALESLYEMVLGYMIAIPYSFVYLRCAEVSTSRVAKVLSYTLFALFLFWGIVAAVLRDRITF